MLLIKLLDKNTGKCLVEEEGKEVISSLPQLEELGFSYDLSEEGWIQYPDDEISINDIPKYFE